MYFMYMLVARARGGWLVGSGHPRINIHNDTQK